ncbi:alpha-D-ribose 1-methylphosphonate 5-triphosphate diphosphatase [Desulfocicer vacuolatum]|uniref:alpha-D-ribose 1-methylphosphonate 5-triphosphate diphosphatase n=1 Tax=Desulfocicer vacuolatum TaxID=2298 RepID=UPI001BB00DD7|nr:alpha-D-ribose 1-methylphosphonate 5-triphosphate diphosphatase [Desulfocicer vacuolatum]
MTDAKFVTPEGVVEGTLTVRDGKIDDLAPKSPSGNFETIDCAGDYIIPGLIELHTDNLEGDFQPRPGVIWPSRMLALHSHDSSLISSGITTVLDSVSCGQFEESKLRHEMLTMSIAAIKESKQKGLLRADHLLHLRCEVCDPYVMDMFLPHVDEPNLKLVSLMDHTPGQRQFCNIDKYKEYYKLEKLSEEEFGRIKDELVFQQDKNADVYRQEIIRLCHARNIPLASHDDTTPEHVYQAKNEGLVLSEFPTTVEAAQQAKKHGLGIIMGAPNVVRNGSHSGNVSARELARQGLLNILSSDYVPVSLLHGAYLLHSEVGLDLHDAFATVTANPAKFLGLDDRGTIEAGRLADLARISIIGDTPMVRSVWRAGKNVF